MNCYSLSQYSKQSCPLPKRLELFVKKYNVDSVCFQHRCMWKKANVVQLYNLMVVWTWVNCSLVLHLLQQ